MIIGIIPARMNSSRFPGKPMKTILGMPMVGHCMYRARLCESLDRVIVATCDAEIYDYVISEGFECIMTSSKHERASDRIAEALLIFEQNNKCTVDYAVLLQGDEPMTAPKAINDAVQKIIGEPNYKVLNLFGKITEDAEFRDFNTVKVVINSLDEAMYFSREPVPSSSLARQKFPKYKQICVIPFERNFLLDYTKMQPSLTEIVESVDMNRVLDYGGKVLMQYTDELNFSVDTPEDLVKVTNLMLNDRICKSYIK